MRLYFVHPLRHDGREIESVIADIGVYGETDHTTTLQGVQAFVFSDGSVLEVDGEKMTVFHENVAAARMWSGETPPPAKP